MSKKIKINKFNLEKKNNPRKTREQYLPEKSNRRKIIVGQKSLTDNNKKKKIFSVRTLTFFAESLYDDVYLLFVYEVYNIYRGVAVILLTITAHSF